MRAVFPHTAMPPDAVIAERLVAVTPLTIELALKALTSLERGTSGNKVTLTVPKSTNTWTWGWKLSESTA